MDMMFKMQMLQISQKMFKKKLLRFGRAAVAVATMRGKSYLQIGSITMGIAGSIISPEFFEEYLGMRVESVDEVEIIRRMTEGIYDHAEFEKSFKNGLKKTANKVSIKTQISAVKLTLKKKKLGNLL